MVYKPLVMGIEESRNNETTQAIASKTEALLAYVAVMAGVELPSEEESEAEEYE